ncbi:MarR family winged helix-turn-helix transcriptional regulator [Nitratireductor sp. CH_MIT9313-5]|uniref:MarR family winged helix-turn-helix transcriptional regulator n=1 Tax=Nitratireductor sp. CH_MIT9313-5 TaxID=3107764 RepID=UPI00300BA2AB
MGRALFAVEQWRKEKPDLDLLPMEVIGLLSEASSMVTRNGLAPFFKRCCLQPGEFDVLATLRRAGKPHALTPTELYEATMVTSGAMTNRIDRLEQAGLVARKANPQDRRGVVVELTQKGFELIDKAIVDHVENERRLLSGLTETEQRQLAGLLCKLVRSEALQDGE